MDPSDDEKELVKNLKDHFEFYIVPMINVDGVVNGNYRCSLAACDLNRKFQRASKTIHPTVYYLQKMITRLQETENRQFFLYLDFHGHSAKKNIFQYGNKTENWAPSSKKGTCNHQPQVFPMMVSKQFDYFNFPDCTFSMPKYKESTARVSMFHQLRIPYVFTMEASFAGASIGSLAGQHFSIGDLMNVGRRVLKAIWEVKKLDLNKSLLKQIQEEATKNISKAEGDDSDSNASSSEDENEMPASKKVFNQIELEDQSPNNKKSLTK